MGKFGIGVRVRYVGDWHPHLSGKSGTIYATPSSSSVLDAGERDVIFDDFIDGHDGDANDGSDNHWYVDKAGLELVTWEPKVGQKVKWLGKFESPSYTVGGVYEITRADDGAFDVTNDWSGGFWSEANVLTENFELVAEPAAATPAPLTLEVGKTYRTRDGRKAAVLRRMGDGDFAADIDAEPCERCFNPDGKHWMGLTQFDLVAEWVEPAFKLEVGRFYKDRTGCVVGPIERHESSGTDYPWMIDGGRKIYMDDGTNYDPGEKDLVELAAEPKAEPKYKVGDRVKCIDSSGAPNSFVVGNTYVVSRYRDDTQFPFIEVEGVISGMYAHRFEPAAPLAVGDKVTVTGTITTIHAYGNVRVDFGDDHTTIPATLLRAA